MAHTESQHLSKSGLRATYDAIRTANGPAQHIAISIVGLTYTGMFHGMVPEAVLISWALSSLAVLVSTVWLTRWWLKRALILDFFLSCIVLSLFMMHKPAPTGFVYYSRTAEAMKMHMPSHTPMSFWDTFSHGAACVMMAIWSLYLANLVHRQMLERSRFDARL